MLFFRRNGPLGFHCCQLRDILILSSTLRGRVSQKMLTCRECENLSFQSLMELAVVDSKPAVLRCIEDIGVAVAEANVGMVVGLSRMDGLRRNNVISGHHHHKRNV